MVSTKEPNPAPERQPATPWHTLTPDELAEKLAVSLNEGLSAAEAEKRLQEYGPNELVERGRRSPLLILAEQFTSPLVVVLIVAAALSAVIHGIGDAIVIGIILVLNGVIGFVQEYRADQSMQALRKLSVPQVRVRRGGQEETVAATKVVPGDVILLQAGDFAPADARILEASNLRVDEAALTGESEPVDKTDKVLTEEDVPLAERRNMVYRGTAVVYGRGEALIVATGMNTELGAIANMLQTTEETATPLQRRLAELGKTLALWALVLCAVILGIGLLRGEPLSEMLVTAVALAVAAIPEGLPAVVTIALAIGARRMAARNALVRSLPAVEGLGAVTVICSDKTGTLTRNEMTVTNIITDSGAWKVTGVGCVPESEIKTADGDSGEMSEALRRLLLAGVLCNDAAVQENGESPDSCPIVGDPTEGALLTVAMKAGLSPEALRSQYPRLDEVPFESETKRMATLHEIDGEPVVMVKGSPEVLVELCTHRLSNGESAPLDEERRQEILERVAQLASNGRRVLAFAERRGDRSEPLDRNLTYLGLVGMIDPPRQEAREAVAQCRSAGIRPVMITGDHRLTAEAIAKELGIMEHGDRSMDGRELDALEPGELEEVVEEVAVYARVTPEHKLRLVDAFQSHGHIVAMTGDGVNDAPALREADIGVAMGVVGTDVSREASRLVLADDNFATIVAAVREGRIIFDNMRKFLRFLLNTNLAEILTMLTALLLGWPVPLLALQILWINLVTDGLPALALGFEPGAQDIMQRKPRDPRQGLITRDMLRDILFNGIFMAAGVLAVMRMGTDLAHQRTIAFTTLALAQIANCVACRSERQLIMRIGFFSNPHMIAAGAISVIAQLVIVYVPFLGAMFQTVPLSSSELGLCFGVALLVFVFAELQKLLHGALGRGAEQEAQPG
ncbi:MAG: cation-translocating P-type ATPase [Armatimonadetes bacterium]|nr:cation-translocating P-type ATPase [Armatimonadota bacterium]